MKTRKETFRGFSNSLNRWVYGDLLHNVHLKHEGKTLDYAIRSVGEWGEVFYEVDPWTIGRKLTEEIYEGDYLQITAKDGNGVLHTLKGFAGIDSEGFCVTTENDYWPVVDWSRVVEHKVIGYFREGSVKEE